MDVTSVGAMSVVMSMAKTQQAANIAMIKNAMDLQQSQADFITQNIQAAAPAPPSSHLLDRYI